MPITVSPNQNVETVVGIPVCFEAVAIYSLPQEDQRCIDLPASGLNWTFSSSQCKWTKVSGSLGVVDANATVTRTVYGKQPFYIWVFNPTFTTPPAPNRFFNSFAGVLSDTNSFYGWEVFKNCGNQSTSACNATTSSNPSQNWQAFVVVNGTIVNPLPSGVNANERFRLRSDGINLFWDYNHAGFWQNGVYTIPLPVSSTWQFNLNSAWTNNEWWDIQTFVGTFQGQIPITWTTPLGGTLTGSGNNRCFSAGTPGIYSVCLDTEFDEPLCVPVTVDTLFLEPVGLDCGECAFVRSTVEFNSNGGFNGILTAKDPLGQPVGTILDSLTWQAPAFPVVATLTYTLGVSTATCVINVVDPLKVLNVDGNAILGLVPGDLIQLETNYPAANVKWENLTCPSVVSPDGIIYVPKNPNDPCFNALDCTIRVRLVSIPGLTCNNITASEIEGVTYLDFRVVVDPVYPTPDFGGPNPVKWKPEVPDYRVLVNTMEGGCTETHIRNKVATYKWTVDYVGLPYDYNNPCRPIPCCDATTGFVNGTLEGFNVAKRLDDFWNFVMGQYGYFTLIDQKTGVVWKKVRFNDSMTRDHINWFRTQSRTVSMIWSPCCAKEPEGGTCVHQTVITDNIAPNTVLNLRGSILCSTLPPAIVDINPAEMGYAEGDTVQTFTDSAGVIWDVVGVGPTYLYINDVPCLRFNGSTMAIKSRSNVNLSGTSKLDAFCRLNFLSSDISKIVYEHGNNLNTDDPSIFCVTDSVTGNSVNIGHAFSAGANLNFWTTAEEFRTAVRLVHCHSDTTLSGGNETVVKVDNVLTTGAHTSGTDTTGNFGSKILYVGARTGTTTYAHFDLYRLRISSFTMSSSQFDNTVANIMTPEARSENILIMCGDSRFTPFPGLPTSTTTIPTEVAKLIDSTWRVVNVAIAGQEADQVNANFATQILPYLGSQSVKKVVISGAINDLYSGSGNKTPAQAKAILDTFISNCVAAGAEPYVCTETGVGTAHVDYPQLETRRLALNTLERDDPAWDGVLLDIVTADVGLDDGNNAALFLTSDTLHPTDAGKKREARAIFNLLFT